MATLMAWTNRICGSNPRARTMRASCRRYLCLSATLSTAQQAPSDDAELEVVAEGARRPCEAVMLEIGICHVDRLRHTDKSVTQLFARHAERHDVGAIAITRVVVVQPPCLP